MKGRELIQQVLANKAEDKEVFIIGMDFDGIINPSVLVQLEETYIETSDEDEEVFAITINKQLDE